MDNSDQSKMIKYCLIALGVIAVFILIVFIQMLIGPSKEVEDVATTSSQTTVDNTNTQTSSPQRIIERVEKDDVKVENANTNTATVQNPLDVLNGKKDGIVAVYENTIVYEASDNSSKVVMEFNPENQNMTEMYMEFYWPTEEYAITYVEQFVGTDMENQVSRDGTIVKVDFMGENEELEFKKDDVIKSVEGSYNIDNAYKTSNFLKL